MLLALGSAIFNEAQAQYAYNIRVDQVRGGGDSLFIDVYVERTGGTPFAFGNTNLQIDLTGACLNLTGSVAFLELWSGFNGAIPMPDVDGNASNIDYSTIRIAPSGGTRLVFTLTQHATGAPNDFPPAEIKLFRALVKVTDCGCTNSLAWTGAGPNWPGTVVRYKSPFVAPFEDLEPFGTRSVTTPSLALQNINIITPPPAEVCFGENTGFESDEPGTWSFNDLGSGITMAWAGPNTGVNSASLTVGTSGTLTVTDTVRAYVTRPGPNGCTDSIDIVVRPQPFITADPSDSTVCAGGSVFFAATAGGYDTTFKWLVSSDGGTTWAPAVGGVYSGTNNDTLFISDVSGLDGNLYALEVASNTCNNLDTSLAATLTVLPQANIDTEPSNTTVCSTDGAFFGIIASGAPTLTYQWESSPDNIIWTPVSGGVYSGEATDTLVISSAAGLNGTFYRVVVGSTSCSAKDTSLVVSLTVNDAPTISADPVTAVQCEGQDTLFRVTATGTGLTYAWQESTDGGSSWVTLSDFGVYSGTANDTLFIADVSGLDGNMYRAIVIGVAPCVNDTSAPAMMTVNPLPVINSAPISQLICEDSTGSLVAEVFNATSLQWQVSSDGGTSWNNVVNGGDYDGATTDSLSIFGNTLLDGNLYRLVVTNSCGSDTSTNIPLFVSERPGFDGGPSDITACAGDADSFFASVNGDVIAFIWEVSSDAGATWNQVFDGGIYSGATTNSLDISDVTGLDGYLYRLILDGDCVNDTATVSVTVYSPAIVATDPSDTTVCDGVPALFVVVPQTGQSAYNIQWQESTDGGVTWTNLVEGFPYTGTTNDSLSIATTISLDTYQYRAYIQDPYACFAADTSSPAELTVNATVSFDALVTDETGCQGSTVTFAAGITGSVISYQWQESTNGGITWSPLANAGIYAGVDTDTLIITGVTLAMDGYRYRLVVDGVCGDDTSAVSGNILTVLQQPTIVDQPKDSTVCAGANATFSVTATGTGLTYQWEESTDGGGTWIPLSNGGIYSNVTNATLQLTGIPLAAGGNQYRVVVSGTCSPSVTSGAAVLTVNALPAVTVEPTDQTVCDGGTVLFNTTVTGTGLTYQWEVSTNGGVSWGNVPGLGIYSGSTTDDLTISPVDPSLDGYIYRLQVTGTCGLVTSLQATLTVNNGPQISVPAASSITINTGATVEFNSLGNTDWFRLVAGAPVQVGTATDSVSLYFRNSTSATITDTVYTFDGLCTDTVFVNVGTSIKLSIEAQLFGPSDTSLSTPTMVNRLTSVTGYGNILASMFERNITATGDTTGWFDSDSLMAPGKTVPANAVDLILIELRDASGLTIIDSAYAWLLDDNTIRDFATGDSAYVDFVNAVAGNYRVVVKHRNHLAIISTGSALIDVPLPPTPFDLTSPASVSGGSNGAFIYKGVAMMFAGNVVDNYPWDMGETNAFDFYYVILGQAVDEGYVATDLDLNGYTTAADFDIMSYSNDELRRSEVIDP